MEEIKIIFLGVIASLTVLFIHHLYKRTRKKNLLEEKDFLEWEKSHLELIKRSSVALNRSSFNAIFRTIFLIGLAQFIPALIIFINPEFTRFAYFTNAVFWLMVVSLSFHFFKRFDKLKNYKESIEEINQKLSKLDEKLSNI